MTTQTPKPDRTAAIRWPLFLAGLFSINVFMVATTIYKSVTDETFAVEPDYYAKAMAWDDTRAATHTAEESGLIVNAAATPEQILVVLSDESGPVTGASVEAEYFHRARAADRRSVALAETAPGAYAAPAEVTRVGLYDLRLTIAAGDRVTACTRTVEQRGRVVADAAGR
jgi:nitrogen fixation protein FixH